MDYRKIPIPNLPRCKQYISFVYQIENKTDDFIYTTIPNGSIGFSFIQSGEASILRKSGWESIPRCSVFGLTNKIEHFKHSKTFKEICIGFNPEIFQLIVKENMSLLSKGNVTDLGQLFSKGEFDILISLINENASYSIIWKEIEHILFKIIMLEKFDSRLNYAVKLIKDMNFNKVEKIANEVNVTTATLRNVFRNNIGVSPKDFIRTNRIHKILKQNSKTNTKLTDLAYSYGYFDQAHMTHEFKKVLQITPKDYFRNESLVFDFYNFGRWQNNSFAV